MEMPEATNKKIEILSVTYRIEDKIYIMKPSLESLEKHDHGRKAVARGGPACTPGDTKCINGCLQYCVNWQGEPTWMESDEPCQ